MSSRGILTMAVLLVPALFTLLHQPLRAQRWGRGLDVATHAVAFATISIYAMLLIGWPRGWGALFGVQPLRLSMAATDLFRLFLFSLWFGLASRLLQVSRKDGAKTKPPDHAPRAASPASRSGASPVSTKSWRFAWGIWWYGAVASLASLLVAEPVGPTKPWAAAVVLLALALALVWSGPAVLRETAMEAEPTDARGSRELADAYAIHRNRRTAGYYWLALALVTWMSITPMVGMWIVESSDSLRVVSEVTAFGIAIGGAVFGLEMAAGRERLRRILGRLIADEEAMGRAGLG